MKKKKPVGVCIGQSEGVGLFVDPKSVKVSGPVVLDAGGGGANGDQPPGDWRIGMLVAERVMGWTVPRLSHGGAFYDSVGRAVRDKPHDCRDFRPWESIAHAWEVVEVLRQRFRVTVGDDSNGKMVATLMWRDGDTWNEHIGKADTAPLAICRAALKVAGA